MRHENTIYAHTRHMYEIYKRSSVCVCARVCARVGRRRESYQTVLNELRGEIKS